MAEIGGLMTASSTRKIQTSFHSFSSTIVSEPNRQQPLPKVSGPTYYRDKNKMPIWAFNFYGGDRGIRTLDTVSCIRDFESRAFNQLCHISGTGLGSLYYFLFCLQPLNIKIIIFYRFYYCANQFILMCI